MGVRLHQDKADADSNIFPSHDSTYGRTNLLQKLPPTANALHTYIFSILFNKLMHHHILTQEKDWTWKGISARGKKNRGQARCKRGRREAN